MAKKQTRPKTQPEVPKTPDTTGVMAIIMIAVALIDNNTYNPNEHTSDQKREHKKEIKRTGRLPHPILVRKKGDRYEVIDGEHSLAIAKELGMTEVPCTVGEADDREAMLQCYKRTQHGTLNPVKLGRQFNLMIESGISIRKLAPQLDLSDGTVRNRLQCAEAADLRNRYAPDRALQQIAGLTVEQVQK